MIDEEYENHNCLPKIKGWKTINIAHFYTNKDPNGNDIIHILGWDGIDYEFLEQKDDKIHSKLPYQPTGNTDNIPTRKQSLIEGSVASSVVFLAVNSRLLGLILASNSLLRFIKR